MHSIVGQPILFVFLVCLFVYGAALPIVHFNGVNNVAAAVITALLLIVISIVASVYQLLFFREYFDDDAERVPLNKSIWGILNSFLVITHIVANLGYAIWLFDFSAAKDTIFLNVPSSGGYQAYLNGFLPTASNFVMQTGIVPIRLSPDSVWGSLWSVLGGFVGAVLMSLIFGVIMRSITMHLYQRKKHKYIF